jgi:hypothetical protein
MTDPTTHVVFSPSGAVELRGAVRAAGRADRVACLNEALNAGPINPPDPAVRDAWYEKVLGCYDVADADNDNEGFWGTALRDDGRLVAWVWRRSTTDYCGFLEWLWRLGSRPCEIVDLTDVMGGPGARSDESFPLALWPPAEIVRRGLFDLAEPLGDDLRRSYHAAWRRLREENAPLRVLENGELRSAPITYFDPQLLSHVTNDWQKMARVVGWTLVDFMDGVVYQSGDLLLFARLRALAEAGKIEWRGDLNDVRNCWLRLP